MAREILLYVPVFPETVKDFIKEVEDAKGEDVHVRVASPGGSVLHGWGMVRKMTEHRESGKKVTGIVDGLAWSMGSAILPFMDSVKAVRQAELMIHKAAGPVDSDEDKRMLDTANENLKEALKEKVDEEKLKEMKRISIDDLFDPKADRKELWLTGQEAFDIGLVDEVVGAGEMQAQATQSFGIAAYKVDEHGKREKIDRSGTSNPENSLYSTPNKETGDEKPSNEGPSIMELTAESLKRDYPSVAEQVRKEGIESGAQEERDRINAWMNWIDVDPEKVKNAIQEGKKLTQSELSDLTYKMTSQKHQEGMKQDSPDESGAPSSGEGGDSQETGDPEAQAEKQFLESAIPGMSEKLKNSNIEGEEVGQILASDSDNDAPAAEPDAGESAVSGEAASVQ